MGNRHWGQRKVSVNATGRGPKLTARRLGGDKQSTQPGGVHPGLDTGREARHLRNNCSGRHERNTMSVEINNPYEHMKLSVNARGRGPNLTARRLGGDKQSTQPGDVHPRLDTGHAAGCLRNNCSGRNERNQLSVGKMPPTPLCCHGATPSGSSSSLARLCPSAGKACPGLGGMGRASGPVPPEARPCVPGYGHDVTGIPHGGAGGWGYWQVDGHR